MKKHGTIGTYLLTVLRRWLLLMAGTLGVGIVFGLLLGAVRGTANSLLYSVFGWAGIVATGLVGTPVHEFAHFIMCLIFGFQVNEVALFRPIAGKSDGILGYVNYSYDPSNAWQRIGTFFVGIAPMLLGVGLIILVLRLLTPEVLAEISLRLKKTSASVPKYRKSERAAMPLRLFWAAVCGFFAGLFKLRGWGILRGAAAVYITCSIAMHLELSTADLSGALPGLLLVMLVMLAATAVISFFKTDFESGLIAVSTYISLYLAAGIFLCLIVLALSFLFTLIL